MQTWLTEKVVSINNDGLLSELVDNKTVQLIQLFESNFVRVKVIPTCQWQYK